nr:TonB family protein [uncultured Brevundimonas sp.]
MAKHWLIGSLISAALHGGMAAAILVSAPPMVSGAQIEPEPAITVELFRAGDMASGGAPAKAERKPDLSAASNTPASNTVLASKMSADKGAGSSPASGDAVSASPSPAVLSDYYRRLETHLARFHTYPALERRRPQGLARVGLIVNRDGHVLDTWIETSSGSPELDEAALQTVRRSDPLPALPGNLPGSIDLIVPLNFDAGLRAAS